LEIHSRSKNKKILPLFVTQGQRVNRVFKKNHKCLRNTQSVITN